MTVSKNASLVKSVASYCAIAKIQNKKWREKMMK